MQQFKNLIGEIERQREELYRAHEAEILGLILNICKKILHREVQLQQEVILDTLREAFKYVVDRRKVILHLNPTDYEYLLAHSDRFSLNLKDMEGVKMVQDPSITRGGCFLETAFGDIDGTIESQFDQIVSLVWKRFEQPE